MVKALFRKQMLEIFDVMFRHGRNQRKRTYAGTILSIVILGFVLYILGRLLYNVADMTCELFVSTEYGWCYFAVVGILATILGVLSSIFAVHSTVYQAKDNELLLSMPIRPGVILFMRLFSSYLICFVFETVVMLPFFMVFWKISHPNGITVFFNLMIMILFPALALVISCLLGWVVAVLNSILPNRLRNAVNFLISFVFVIGFLNLCIDASGYMRVLQNNAEQGNVLMNIVTGPFVCMGKAALGSWNSFLMLVLILAVMAGILYWVLGNSFQKLSHNRYHGRTKSYQESRLKSSSLKTALLRKEFRRYFSSSSYYLNSSLGSILLLVCFVLMLMNYQKLQNGIAQVHVFSINAPFLTGIILICILTGINSISASSISAEGNNLWIMKSLPISEMDVIGSKMMLQFILTAVPQMLCSFLLAYLLKKESFQSVFVILVPFLFVLFTTELGMMLNLYYPKFDWVSESSAVRKSTSSRLSVLISWALVLIAVIVFRRLPEQFSIMTYLVIVSGILIALIAGCYIWIQNKGKTILSSL